MCRKKRPLGRMAGRACGRRACGRVGAAERPRRVRHGSAGEPPTAASVAARIQAGRDTLGLGVGVLGDSDHHHEGPWPAAGRRRRDLQAVRAQEAGQPGRQLARPSESPACPALGAKLCPRPLPGHSPRAVHTGPPPPPPPARQGSGRAAPPRPQTPLRSLGCRSRRCRPCRGSPTTAAPGRRSVSATSPAFARRRLGRPSRSRSRGGGPPPRSGDAL